MCKVNKATGEIALIFAKHAIIPIVVYVGYMSLCNVLSDKSTLNEFSSWSPKLTEPILGYQDAGSLFNWITLVVLASIFSGLTLIIAVKQLYRRVDRHSLVLLVAFFALFAGIWVYYIYAEVNSALRMFAFEFARGHLEPIYASHAASLFDRIKLVSRLLAAVAFPIGALGAMASVSLLLTIPAHASLNPTRLDTGDPIPKSLKRVLDSMPVLPANADSSAAKRQGLDGDAEAAEVVAADLKSRTDTVKTLMLLGSGTLTVATLFTYNWLTWPADYFANDADKSRLTAIAAGFTFYWGIGISIFVAMIYVPVMTQVRKLSLSVARSHGQTTHASQLQWLTDRGIEFVDPKGFREIAVMLAPLLAAPLGTIMQRAPGF